MRDPARIPVLLDLLRQVWERCPDLRLGQIVVAAAMRGGWWEATDPFHCEDEIMEKGITKMLKEGGGR